MPTEPQRDLALEWRLAHLKGTDAELAWIRRMRAVPKRSPTTTPKMVQQLLFELPAMKSNSRRRYKASTKLKDSADPPGTAGPRNEETPSEASGSA
jgi:hypothetical protein